MGIHNLHVSSLYYKLRMSKQQNNHIEIFLKDHIIGSIWFWHFQDFFTFYVHFLYADVV